jgi:hypothetical protein
VLLAAFALLSLAVLLGLLLAVLHVRAAGGRARARLGLLHGGAGAAGVAVLLLARRDAVAQVLAWDAVALLAAALLGGAVWYVWQRRGRPPELVLVLHGAAALIGYALLAALAGGG